MEYADILVWLITIFLIDSVFRLTIGRVSRELALRKISGLQQNLKDLSLNANVKLITEDYLKACSRGTRVISVSFWTMSRRSDNKKNKEALELIHSSKESKAICEKAYFTLAAMSLFTSGIFIALLGVFLVIAGIAAYLVTDFGVDNLKDSTEAQVMEFSEDHCLI